MAVPHSKPAQQAFVGELSIRTERRTQLFDITAGVQRQVKDSGASSGVCHVYIPHTTAGVTINEHDDPNVALDIEAAMDRLVPNDAGYRHAEGNSDSHIKAALIGNSVTIFIAGGKLDLGRWQGVFFCEFDGPRARTIKVRIVLDQS
jgi:secondary thiamine-phosphate synthase enzyme